MYQKLRIFVIVKLLLLTHSLADELKVCLDNLGCLKGTYMPGYQMEKFQAFLGIPYAKPPIGDLRFRNPEPVDAWPNVLSVTAPKSDCIQKNYFVNTWPISGEEDCLYLNVYRPVKYVTSPLPVMFYIHGGGFFSGSPNPGYLGPEYFMDTEEVILVIVGYRLGPFGFLSTGDENMPGNFGLKDQNLALKWVHDNIAAFGGDPSLVTIFGHSAGGCAVHFHILSTASRGLFQRAIIMSGSVLAPFVNTIQQPHVQAIKLAEAAGVSNAKELSKNNLADRLRAIDAIKLLNAGDSLKFWDFNPMVNYRPIIESDTWHNSFLTKHPSVIVKSGNYTHVPWMMGVVSSKGEGAVIALNIFNNDKLHAEMNQDFDNLLTKMMEFPEDTPVEMVNMVMNMINQEYLHGEHTLNNATVEGFMELFGDVCFYYPFYKSIQYNLRFDNTQQTPLYVFKFNYRGPYSYSKVLTGSLNDFGVIHADDLIYLFRSPNLFQPDFKKNSIDAKLLKSYIGLYVDFAKTGKPQRFNKIGSCNKTAFDTDDEGICNYLAFNNNGGAFKEVTERNFNIKRMHFWDKIFGNHY